MEVSGFLVVPAVFKTDVADYVGQAGSIPVRLRQPWACGLSAVRPGGLALHVTSRRNEGRPASDRPTTAFDR
jgi:hypothetical protein